MTVCVSETKGASKMTIGKWGYLRQGAVIALINVPVMSFGLALGWVSIATGETGDLDGSNADRAVIIAAAVTFAAGLLGVPLSAKAIAYGRKPAVLVTSLLFAICWTLKLIGGIKWWWLVTARTVAGLAGEGAWCIAPILTTEMVSPELRGAAGASLVLAHNLGSLLAYLAADMGLNHRTLLWCCLATSLVHIALFLVVPESPAYLAAHSKLKEARASLAWLRCVNKDDPVLDAELAALPPPDGPPVSPFTLLKELWSSLPRRKAFIIALSVVVGQEVCGLFALMQYAERFFVIVRDTTSNHVLSNVTSANYTLNMTSVNSTLDTASVNGTLLNVASEVLVGASLEDRLLEDSGMTPARHALVLGGVQLVAAVAALYLVEKVGRRRLLIWSSLSVSVCVAVAGGAVWRGGKGAGNAVSVAAAAAVVADSIGVEPVAYAVLPEMFHYRFRSLAVTTSMALVDVAHTVEMLAFPTIVSVVGLAPALLGAGFLMLVYCAMVVIYLPETRALTPDEIYSKIHQCKTEKCCETDRTDVSHF